MDNLRITTTWKVGPLLGTVKELKIKAMVDLTDLHLVLQVGFSVYRLPGTYIVPPSFSQTCSAREIFIIHHAMYYE